MKQIKINVPVETWDRLRALVGDKYMSKFVRDALEGALKTAEQVRSTGKNEE